MLAYTLTFEQTIEHLKTEKKQKSMNELKNILEHLKHSELNKDERQFIYEVQTLFDRGINTLSELPVYATSKLEYLCMLHQIDPKQPFKSVFRN